MVFVTQRPLAHVGKLDCAFRAGVHKPIAAGRVELRSRNHFRQLLHVCGFDIDNVETLVLNIKVPQIDSEVITTNKSFPVAVNGDAVYVVCVCICIRPSRHGCHNGIMMRHPGKLQH